MNPQGGHRVVVALGSNLGRREAYLRRAGKAIGEIALGPASFSRVFETPPMGPGHQRRYLNQCVVFRTALSPRELLEFCRRTETALGRRSRARWASREIDIDILLFNEAVIREPDLTVPHPGMAQRQFVLVPLCDLDPGLRIPGLDATVAELLERSVAARGREDIRPYGEADRGAKAAEAVRYVCVEGVIGAGKSTLVRLLSRRLGFSPLYEDFKGNPFLSGFYQDRRRYAFQTQIFFLLSRHRQVGEMLHQQDLFRERMVSDYMFAKDRIFAALNLDENELALYDKLWALLEKEIPRPDFVIYLQADTSTLMRRVRRRDRPYERAMAEGYIEALNQTYNSFFHHYQDSPLLIVNTNRIDFVRREDHLEMLIREILAFPAGTTYFSPDMD